VSQIPPAIGPYQVLAQLGEGGMGVVYRARDPKLSRDVAIKVLPEAFALDAERLARFTREAQVLASLNHPGIAQVYAIEGSAIVMELVEGEDLAERLKRGPIPLDEAIPFAQQIAEALEAAHDAGIIHRDLKPANIKVREDGTVKVLDFGLAKAVDEPKGSSLQEHAPTITTPAMTMRGVILGTAAYMAPEQARGRAVDHRADTWAFGAVLYEMLSGRRAFDGDDTSITIASVLKEDVKWDALPGDLPPSITRLLRRCLEKDPKKRLDSIRDARLDLDDAGAGHDVAPLTRVTSRSARLPWVAAALLLVSSVALSVPYFRADPPPGVMRFQITAPPGRFVAPAQFAISPDGKYVAFVTVPVAAMFLRSMETGETTPLAGTGDAQAPFWSPDSQSIGFFANNQLKSVDIAGGSVRTLCRADGAPTGTWSTAGVIVFGSPLTTGLLSIPATGGSPTQLTTPDRARGEAIHVTPHFLPDGKHLLYSALSGPGGANGTFVTSLDGGTPTRILESSHRVEFAPPNQLLFVRQESLFAQSFDPVGLRLEGTPRRLTERLQFATNLVANGRAAFSVSRTGVLVVVIGEAEDWSMNLGVYDRSGKRLADVGQGNFLGIELSPDGQSVVTHPHDNDANGGDLFITHLQQGAVRRFTFEPSEDASSPVWSPDGLMIAFAALRNGRWGVYRKPADGSGTQELLHESAIPAIPMAWTPDGATIVVVKYPPDTQGDLWNLPVSGDRTPTPYFDSPLAEAHPQISPNGRWLSYTSYPNTSAGLREVWVQSYPVPGTQYQVPVRYARQARWRDDGKELFFWTDDALSAVTVDINGSALAFGPPRTLFKTALPGGSHRLEQLFNYFNYDVSPDGQRFVIPNGPARDETAPPMTVILNWPRLVNQ
jgi:eukaryotic-like serine/threonine-protein kinase